MNELKTEVDKCTANDAGISIGSKDDNDAEAVAEAASLTASLDEYFSAFAKPTTDGKCLKCGRVLGGLMGWALGGFRWGLAWGEGNCGCGWPARAYHDPKDSAGEKIFDRPLQLILQYHPENVGTKREESDEE